MEHHNEPVLFICGNCYLCFLLRESLAGNGSSLVEEVQESLRQQGEALEEVGCIEKTLLRRRAELREADRLLLEAESDLKDTRAKVSAGLPSSLHPTFLMLRTCCASLKRPFTLKHLKTHRDCKISRPAFFQFTCNWFSGL